MSLKLPKLFRCYNLDFRSTVQRIDLSTGLGVEKFEGTFPPLFTGSSISILHLFKLYKPWKVTKRYGGPCNVPFIHGPDCAPPPYPPTFWQLSLHLIFVGYWLYLKLWNLVVTRVCSFFWHFLGAQAKRGASNSLILQEEEEQGRRIRVTISFFLSKTAHS